jgi:sialidase-1
LIVDEITGDILIVQISDQDKLWRSSDQGKTWKEDKTTLKPNEMMKRLEQTGLRKRSDSRDEYQDVAKYYMHTGAAESGITLRHGKKRGRLLSTATFRPYAKAHPSDRDPVDAIYSCAIYSDDRGATWQVSGLFPEGYTEEAALAELQDGRIYYNSRSHKGFYDKARARKLLPEETLRRIAWSYDEGETWEDLRVSRVLPDGGGYSRGYGMMGGLVRLPVKNRDVLIYSNADTAGGAREKITVWASFDGGETWPLKRLVDAGPGAYSSLSAGRPGTPSEGQIYLLFEGGEKGRYTAIQVARFNLSWLLAGELTGDGKRPEWLLR